MPNVQSDISALIENFASQLVAVTEAAAAERIQAALAGAPITLYGDGGQTRDFTFVADAVAATAAAGTRGVPGGVYNVGGGARVSMTHVLEVLEGIAGRRLDVRREGAQKGDMRDTYADTTRARQDLGFRPSVALADGLRAEYEWLAASGGGAK